MKHRTIATISVSALLLSLMVWSFASEAAGGKPAANEAGAPNSASEANEQDLIEQGKEEPESDADLGKFGSKIDREEYLRLRGEYFGRLRGIEPGRPFDPSLRGRAIEQMERQEKGRRLESIVNGSLAPAAGGAWTPLGPTPLPNGFAGAAVSGRITSIVVDPSNPNKVYVGTAQGGVWRSLDAGASWVSIFDSAQSLAIGALALAPSSPTTLYVGTGEFNGCSDCFFGVGLYRVDNADTTATLVGPINPSITLNGLTYNIFNGRGITKILVHPTDPATIFVATGRGVAGSGGNALGLVPNLAPRGLFRSTNATSGSVTFEKLVVTTDGSATGESPGTGDCDTTDVVMEPGNPNNLLVGVLGRSLSVPTSGVYRTTNALAATPTFTQQLSLASSGAAGIRIQLAINKVGAVVTAYAATSETPVAGACTSVRSGALHKTVDPFGAGPFTWAPQLAGGGGFCGGQCFYDMPIAVDPNDANVVYIGGQASSLVPFPPSPCSAVVKKSTDGGATFTDESNWANRTIGLHPDDHALLFDGAGNIYTGTDGGIWKRPTSAASASAWTNLNNAGLNTLQFESIAVHPTDQFLTIGGTQDNGTEYQISSSGNWSGAEGGDGGYALIDQSATDMTDVTMYHTFFNQVNNQIGFDRIFKTACLPVFDSWPVRGVGFGPVDPTPVPCDGGTPLVQANGLSLTDNVLFYAPMALGPGAPNTLYFGTDRLYRSTDRGDTMVVVSQAPLVSGSPISTIGIWRGGDNIRLVGLQNGRVFATSTGSSTMVEITSPSFPANPTGSVTNKFVGRAVIDPNNKNVAYVSFSFFAPAGQGIWKITNLAAAAGASPVTPVWTPAGNGIPSVPINALVIDPQNSNSLYAGTDIGVYNSTDGGANWAPFGTGLPRSAVFDLQIQPSFRILRAGTHGRGVWETALISPGASTMQFSAPADSVNEAQVSKTVTITRAGDTSFPASVNYATSDTSGASPCGSVSGAASSRCDYIATSGTLNFAANETSKSILIPIVDDSYVENSKSFTVTLSAPGGNNVTVGSPGTITITITNDTANSGGANQIDASSFFVREHYIDFLNREPDTPGLNFWVNNINGCTPQPSCTEVQRINTSAAFFLSIEFQDTGYLVYRIYKSAYGNISGSVPVPIRLNDFLPDTQKIGQGVVVNAPGADVLLENNKQAFTEEFVQRPRFLTAFPLTLTPTQFVDGLNTNTGGVLTIAQHDQLISDLSAGIKTRAQVLRAVAENQILINVEFNRAFVLMQYFGYLRRNPDDAPESTLDFQGYNFWLGKLNSFSGNFVNAEMVKSFLLSGEYRQRFGG